MERHWTSPNSPGNSRKSSLPRVRRRGGHRARQALSQRRRSAGRCDGRMAPQRRWRPAPRVKRANARRDGYRRHSDPAVQCASTRQRNPPRLARPIQRRGPMLSWLNIQARSRISSMSASRADKIGGLNSNSRKPLEGNRSSTRPSLPAFTDRFCVVADVDLF